MTFAAPLFKQWKTNITFAALPRTMGLNDMTFTALNFDIDT